MKNFKRIAAIVLAVAMIFALSVNAFAGNPGNVEVTVRTFDYETETYDEIDSFVAVIGSNTYVDDVVAGKYGSNATWVGSYLRGLTIAPESYNSVRYVPVEGTFDELDEYIADDPVIDYLDSLPEFIAHGGVYMSWADLLGDGYFQLGDEDSEYFCSISYDWTYQVDYAADGYGNYVYPPNITSLSDTQYMYTMDECELSAGDKVMLTYGLTWTIFTLH